MSRVSSLSVLGALIGVGACTSIIGIEDLHEGPRTEAEAGEGRGGSNAGSNNGGTGPSAGSPGEGGAGGEAGGGPGPVAGAGGGGEGGSPPQSGPVSGSVIDFWGHPLPNIPIQIGDELISTDDDGRFEFADVPAKYDVSLVADYVNYGNEITAAWVYQGLTRRDPTIQIYQALSERSGSIDISPQNVVTASNEYISIAIGGADGNTEFTTSGSGTTAGVPWQGAATTSMTAHALYWAYDADTDLPSAYHAYDSLLIAVNEANTAEFNPDLTKTTLASALLQGTVEPGGGSQRYNDVFLQFASGATMQLVEHSNAPNEFSYLVPSIPNTSLTVLASEGDAAFGSYAVVRKSGLSPNSTPAMKIPTPPTLLSPATASENVTPTTKFSFQSPPSNPGPFIVQFGSENYFHFLYVVTAEKQITIPEVIGGGFQLIGGEKYYWRVATHGAYGSVDAVARPEGFLQPIDAYDDVTYGPLQDDAEFTLSSGRFVITERE